MTNDQAVQHIQKLLDNRNQLKELLRKCEPIVDYEACGTRGKKEVWELLAEIRNAIQ